MILFSKRKDGGPESPVDGYFLVEIKGLFSIALLKFNKGKREAYHSHAFNAWTWFLKGNLVEEHKSGRKYKYRRSLIPKFTHKEVFHRVKAVRTSWCLTFRGPWSSEWMEYNQNTGEYTVLAHGRKVLRKYK